MSEPAFDFNEPLPDTHPAVHPMIAVLPCDSWEPAARHYRNIEPIESST